jgi:hypothetical protein
MRVFSAVASIGLLVGCDSPLSPQTKYMAAIDEAVVFPHDAHPIADYAKYYSQGPGNDIVAVFILPDLLVQKTEQVCERMKDDLASSSRVSCVADGVPLINAGERFWVEDWHKLPWIFDPKCGDISVVFDRGNSHFKEVRCTGKGAPT